MVHIRAHGEEGVSGDGWPLETREAWTCECVSMMCIGMCECGWCEYGCVCVACEWMCGDEYVDVYRCMCKCVHVHWENPFSSKEVMQRAGISLSGQGSALAFV